MTTVTDVRTGFEVCAIAPAVVRELLAADDAENPPRLLTDKNGGAPLRCCLRPIQPGERVALVSYAPLRRWARETGAEPGPNDEVGRCSSTLNRVPDRTGPAVLRGWPAHTACCAPTALTAGYSAGGWRTVILAATR